MSTKTPDLENSAPTLAEMQHIVAGLPAPDLAVKTAALEKITALQATHSLGKLADLVLFMANAQQTEMPHIRHPRIALFLANYKNTPNTPETKKAVEAMMEGTSALNNLCQTLDADVRLYELLPDETTDGLTPEDSAHAMAYGMMAVEPGVDCLVLDSLSSGAIAAAHTILEKKETSFEELACLAGRDIAAMAGAIIAASLANVPVILGSPAAVAAAYLIYQENPIALTHGILACEHSLSLPGLVPILDKNFAPSPLTGATAVQILRTACEILA